jgi:hypothetical protein
LSQISIDRELLEHILDAYFYMEAENRAYLGMFQAGARRNPLAAKQYFDQLESETGKELSQTEGFHKRLIDQLRTQDDGTFLAALKNKIDLRPRAPKRSQRRSPQ